MLPADVMVVYCHDTDVLIDGVLVMTDRAGDFPDDVNTHGTPNLSQR